MNHARLQKIFLATCLTAILFLPGSNLAQESDQQPDFGGTYSGILPQQKALVDDWFQRFSETIGKKVNPEEGYDNLPLSMKTTFNAVTHALTKTALTDSGGRRPASAAIDIISKVDTVAGDIPGTRGDKQFRIYVQLKPGAQNLLSSSKEFKRSADNSVYHKGYPICFRSTGGTPSIQVSISRDGTRADIDVDYRSSRFPVMLVNGHLSSSNSDVRAGDNVEKHNSQWTGLRNWWRNLLGLPYEEEKSVSRSAGMEVIPAQPRISAKAKPDVAIQDFLNSWLVEQKPNEALAYLDSQAVACMELASGKPLDYGMARVTLLQSFQAANQRIGKVSKLDEIVSGVDLASERLKPVEQAYTSVFRLYDVREDLAQSFLCNNRLDSVAPSGKAARSKDFGKYYGAVFQVTEKGNAGPVVASLWEQVGDYWKLVSYAVGIDTSGAAVPGSSAPVPGEEVVEVVEGDKDLVKASSQFLERWLVRKDPDRAIQFLSAKCLRCVDLYREESTPSPSSDNEAQRMLLSGMRRMSNTAGSVRKLEEAIAAPAVVNRSVKLVRHNESSAFAIVALPESWGNATLCENRKRDADLEFVTDDSPTFGKYYGVGFRMASDSEESAVMWLVWAKEGSSWKVASYAILTP